MNQVVCIFLSFIGMAVCVFIIINGLRYIRELDKHIADCKDFISKKKRELEDLEKNSFKRKIEALMKEFDENPSACLSPTTAETGE
jgi:hypothetical protein